MGRKDWKKDFIMCKIYKDVACCGCGECLEKPKQCEFKETDISKVKFGYYCKLDKDKICDGCMDCL